MGGFISRQPNGLICRHSGILDCITDYNMTEQDYINLCVEKAIAEAKEVIANYMRPFSDVKEYFCENNMTQEEFNKILTEMELPLETRKIKEDAMNKQEFAQWIYENYTIGDNSMARELLENVIDEADGMSETEQYEYLSRMIPQVPDNVIRKVCY